MHSDSCGRYDAVTVLMTVDSCSIGEVGNSCDNSSLHLRLRCSDVTAVIVMTLGQWWQQWHRWQNAAGSVDSVIVITILVVTVMTVATIVPDRDESYIMCTIYYVTGYAKGNHPHTSNLPALTIHNFRLLIDMIWNLVSWMHQHSIMAVESYVFC